MASRLSSFINIKRRLLKLLKMDLGGHGFKAHLFLFSLFLNSFFLFSLLCSEPKLTWTRKATQEAESVARVSCSGHGFAFSDSLFAAGKPVCECNSCYGGPDCSEFSPDCPANADSGDPLFLEPYWMNKSASSAVVIAGWHRMSYTMGDGSVFSAELETAVRQLHKIVGNANPDGKFVVFGAGSAQLLNAAVCALSPENSETLAAVVSRFPYYAAYKPQTEFFKCGNFEWGGDATKWNNSADSKRAFIEFVTSPNNPDGQSQQPVLEGPAVRHIYDHAYYWPHFAPISAAADEDVMLFTLSKLTGHAGSRFGWAFVKDEDVYKRMKNYVSLNTLGFTHDTQLRALKLVKTVMEEQGNEIFEFGFKTMEERWMRLGKAISLSKRFSLPNLAPQYCKYFQKIRGPSPAYSWLKCEMEEDRDCTNVLEAAGIIGRRGAMFGGEDCHVRLSLIKRQDDFDWLLKKVETMVSQEGIKMNNSNSEESPRRRNMQAKSASC